MSLVDEVREQQRESWERFSGGWEKWDTLIRSSMAPVGEEILRLIAPADTVEHLDVAAGTGEPGLTVAERSPQGRVVVTDLAAGMLASAERAAAARGLENVEFEVCSADDLPFDDESFDSVSCRFGLMFVPDIAASVREMARVLRTGGKLCASVWAQPDDNLWATVPLGVIAAEIDLPQPEPDAPGMFRCAAPGAIGEVCEAAGLRDVREVDVHHEFVAASGDEYWALMTEVAAPVAGSLGQVDDAARERIRSGVLERLREFEVDGAPTIPYHARVIVATK